MSAIRTDLPSNPANAQPLATPAASQIRAAQAAFFRAALTEAAATPAARPPETVDRDQPMRAQRPGALLDIRV